MTQAERYTTLEGLLKRDGAVDSSYQAALYLLSSDRDLFEIAQKRISPIGIDFSGIKRDTRDFEEIGRQVVDLAHNLFSWTSKCKVTPFDISRLGYPSMDHAIHAIYIASDMVTVQIQESENGSPELLLDDEPHRRTQRIQQGFAKMLEQQFAEKSSEDWER